MRLYFDYDEVEKKLILSHEQDTHATLEFNVRQQNDNDFKKEGIKRSWMKYAHIPDIVVMQWLKEGIDVFNPDHLPAVKRKLRDPQWRKLRTTLGQI